MLFFEHTKNISKKHFADLALSVSADEAEAGSRQWALAHITSFKYQLMRLERSMAIVNDDVFWLGVDVEFKLLLDAMTKIASPDNAQAIVDILKSILPRLNSFSCQIIDDDEQAEEVSCVLYESILEASEELLPFCLQDLDAHYTAKTSIVHNRRLLQRRRKTGFQKGKEVLWSEEFIAKEEAEWKVMDDKEVAKMLAEDAEKRKAEAQSNESDTAQVTAC